MIHPTAIIDEAARLGANVCIAAFTVVHADVDIGDNSQIGSHCVIGHPAANPTGRALTIGEGAHIRSHSVLYEGSTFGPGLTTGHNVTIRERTEAGLNLQVGTLSDIQGTCRIGDFVRTHSNVHISKLSKIGDFVWFFPYVVLTNDPHPPSEFNIGVTVGDYVSIATMSVILPGVSVGEHALVGAHSCVVRDVEPHTVVVGSPAKSLGLASKISLEDGSGRPAYPWPAHFQRGYPPAVADEMRRAFDRG